ASAAQAKQGRRADMPMRASDWRVGVNIRKMGREIIERRSFQYVIANDIPGLMGTAASHHCTLHRQQFYYTWQLLLKRLLKALMRQRIAGFKTPLRFP